MDVQTTNVGSKVIKHKEIINYTTSCHFTWRQRFKLLFGAKAVTHSVIFTMNNTINIVDTAQITIVGNHKQMPPAEAEKAPEQKKMQAVLGNKKASE